MSRAEESFLAQFDPLYLTGIVDSLKHNFFKKQYVRIVRDVIEEPDAAISFVFTPALNPANITDYVERTEVEKITSPVTAEHEVVISTRVEE